MCVWESLEVPLSLLSVTFFFESVMAVTGDLCCKEEKRKMRNTS